MPIGAVESIDDRRSVVAILFMATAGAFLMALLAFGGAPFAFRSYETSSECRPKSKFFAAFFFSPLDTVDGATESSMVTKERCITHIVDATVRSVSYDSIGAAVARHVPNCPE